MKSKTKQNYDSLAGYLTLGSGVVYGIAAWLLPRSTIGKPLSPSVFPLICAAMMVVFGLLLVLRSSWKESSESLKRIFTDATADDKIAYRTIGIVIVVSIGYALIHEHLGYALSTFLFLEVVMGVTNGYKNWKINTLVSAAFSAGVYYLFFYLLGITLPMVPYLNI